MSRRGPSRLAVIAVTAAAIAVGAGVLAVADRTATGSGPQSPVASPAASGEPSGDAPGEPSGGASADSSGEQSGGASAAAPALAVDQRGCGWFLAYEPGLLAVFNRSAAVEGLDPQQRRLLRAAVIGDTDRIRSALAAGSSADVVAPGFPYTPLTVSVSSQCPAAVDLLLAAGADPDLRLPGESPALVVAVLVGDVPSIVALLEAGADPAATSADGIPVRELARILERDGIEDLLARAQQAATDATAADVTAADVTAADVTALS